MKSILVHTCCGPCLTYPYSELNKNFIVTSYYYNPNIHPASEYLQRVEALQQFCSSENVKLIIDEYQPQEYLQQVAGKESKRCGICYRIRLEKAAKYAAQNSYELFSTTLLVSPYQDHELLKKTGERVADMVGIEFYYKDFRPSFREGQRRAKDMGLYRQKYCGCIYSEIERYREKIDRLNRTSGS